MTTFFSPRNWPRVTDSPVLERNLKSGASCPRLTISAPPRVLEQAFGPVTTDSRYERLPFCHVLQYIPIIKFNKSFSNTTVLESSRLTL